MGELSGTVFNIQHFSVHDGPGIRTVVFLKGCPLRCEWCANPESQVRHLELAWTHCECIGCKNCEKLLGNKYGCLLLSGGLKWNKDIPVTDSKEIKRVCPSGALHVIGEYKTVDEVMSEVEADSVFYANSGGGLTVSGGEPLLHAEFTHALLHEAGQRHIHRAIETTGLAKWDTLEMILRELDYLLIDLKVYNSSVHEKYTGITNEVIIQNLLRIRSGFPSLPIRVRTPVIPRVNDSVSEIKAIASVVQKLGAEYELLKYHRLGVSKYASLGRHYEMGDVTLSDEQFSVLKEEAQNILGGNFVS